MIYFLDTSAILNGGLKKYSNSCISTTVLSELENIKTSLYKNEETKYLAREAVRDIIFNPNIKTYVAPEKKIIRYINKNPYLKDIPDHHILVESIFYKKEINHEVTFITSDATLALLAQVMPDITIEYYFQKEKQKQEEYCGWKKFTPNEDQLISLYSNPTENVLSAAINEYCEIYENNELKDILRWTGEKYVSLKWNNFKNLLGEKIQPRNLEQKMYLDLLQNKNVPIKLCIAKFGTGKSYLALNYALYEIQQGSFDKIVFVKNNLEVKGAGILGTLPGDEIAKQYPWLRQIEDHIGIQKFEEYIESGIIEPAHLNTLRGRDLKNCIILVDEAENLLIKNIQLLLGRVSDNSEIIFCADTKQCDYKDEKMSGIPLMIERLAGNKLFGMVKLLKTERSNVAATADLLD